MGIAGISVWQVGIVVAIIYLVFGNKIFKPAGNVLKSAKEGMKNYRKAVSDDEELASAFDQTKNRLFGSVKNRAANEIDRVKRKVG